MFSGRLMKEHLRLSSYHTIRATCVMCITGLYAIKMLCKQKMYSSATDCAVHKYGGCKVDGQPCYMLPKK